MKPVAGKIQTRIYFATASQVEGPYIEHTEQGPAPPQLGNECPSVCKVGDATISISSKPRPLH